MNEKIDQEFLKKHGINQFQQSKDSRTWVEDIWRESQDAYDSKFSSKESKSSNVLMWQSRLFIPKTYNTIQRILAELLETFFFDPDEIVSVKTNKTVSAETVSAVQCLLNYRLNGHPIDFYQEGYEALMDTLKQKIGILKVYPKILIEKKGKESTKRKEMNQEGIEVEVMDYEDVVKAFEPRIECVAPEDLFLDSEATWKDYWKYPIIHRIAKSRDELRRSGFKNVDDVVSGMTVNATDQTKQNRNWQESPFSVIRDVKDQEIIYDYEIWTFLDLENDGNLKSVVYHMLGSSEMPTVIGKDPVLNSLPYGFSEFDEPRPPFVVGSAMPESHKAYGKDLGEITKSLQSEENSIRNMEREASALAIRNPLLVNRDANLDIKALVNRKIGSIVKGDDIGNDAVRQLQTNNPTINTATISARNQQDYYEATSITPNQLGVSVRDETATAVSNNQTNANKKIQNMIRNISNTLFVPAFRMLLRLEQCYESDQFIQKVTGQTLGWKFANDGAPSWNNIQGDFDLTTEIGVNKQSQLNKFLLVADRMNQTNATLMQMIQARVIDPNNAKFLNTAWAFRQAMGVLKMKNTDEMEISPMAPPPQNEENAQKGLASQPRNVSNPDQQMGQINPEILNEIL